MPAQFAKVRAMWARQLVAAVGSVLLCASTVRADVDPTRWDGGAEFSAYTDTDHVTVFTPALQAAARTGSGWSASGRYLVDVVSAASVDIVSTASPRWNEVRHAVDLGVGYETGDFSVRVKGAASLEPDYVSWLAGAEGSYALSNKQALLSLGYNFRRDIAGRTGTPFSEFALRSSHHGISASVELVLDRATTLTPGIDVMIEFGRQEKPYRFLPLFDPDVALRVPPGASVELVNRLRLPGRTVERLPDRRRRVAASVRLAHRFSSSTLRLWERVYVDGWGMLSTTTDARWIFDVAPRVTLWPAARLHNQSAVTFWRRAYVGRFQDGRVDAPSFRTGDRELARLWTATLGAGVGFQPADSVRLSLQIDAAYTEFPNTLYIDHRWAGFAVAGCGVRF